MRLFLAVLVLGLLAVCAAKPGKARSKHHVPEKDMGEYAEFLVNYNNVMQKVYNDPELKKLMIERVKRVNAKNEAKNDLPEFAFNCTVETSPSPPRNVHELRPSDIASIAAFGDSISAGNGLGAENPVEVAIQNRGEVFSIGGDGSLDEGVTTVAHIVRKFNPELAGSSEGTGGAQDYDMAWLNRAVPGARATHMAAQSADYMDRYDSDVRLDWDEDWKMITLFIGGNDLCRYCRNPVEQSPDVITSMIRDALDELHTGNAVYPDGIPRALVNVVVMFDVSALANLSKGPLCDMLQQGFCGCAIDPETQPEMRQVQLGYWQGARDLINSGRYDTRDDFTVVLQPQMRDLVPYLDPVTGDWDKDILSHDCFHPARKFHYAMAIMLWDAMLDPVGQKKFAYGVGTMPKLAKCPTTQNPYIYTNVNSGGKNQIEAVKQWKAKRAAKQAKLLPEAQRHLDSPRTVQHKTKFPFGKGFNRH